MSTWFGAFFPYKMALPSHWPELAHLTFGLALPIVPWIGAFALIIARRFTTRSVSGLQAREPVSRRY